MRVHWMDRVNIRMMKRAHCFQDGWGDLSSMHEIAQRLREGGPVDPIQPELTAATRVLGAHLRIGHFESPETRLPDEVRTARFWWLHPTDRPVRGAVVMFAAWGDEGPALRGRMVGQLVREGVSIVILENPFYGCRRRAGQVSSGLRTVGDFVLMQGTAWREGRALHAWAQQQIDGPVALVGYSMGGHLAGAIAATTPRSHPLVIAAPPLCPSEPFSRGALSVCVDWDTLSEGVPDPRARWVEIMDLYDVLTLPKPARPELVRIIGASRDGLVPPSHTERIAAAWGSRVDWEPVGHTAIPLVRARLVRDGIRQVLGIPTRTGRLQLEMRREPVAE